MIEGLEVYENKTFYDERGYFRVDWDINKVPYTFKQDNTSFSKFGTLRGLHFQVSPHEQGKLVSVLKGLVWDVAVDIRRDSDTYGEWFGIELSEHNGKSMYIPGGFAHGFIVLSTDGAIFHYKCTERYSPEHERSIRWSSAGIDWPMKPVHITNKDEYTVSLKEYKFRGA